MVFMNERIQELLKQAGFTVMRGHGLKETVPEDVFIANVCVSNETKKLAELIVRECGAVAYKAYWKNPETVRGRHIEEQIRKHFGVEE
jgi:hypothetical protein